MIRCCDITRPKQPDGTIKARLNVSNPALTAGCGTRLWQGVRLKAVGHFMWLRKSRFVTAGLKGHTGGSQTGLSQFVERLSYLPERLPPPASTSS